MILRCNQSPSYLQPIGLAILIIFLILARPVVVMAGPAGGKIQGEVVDKTTGEPLPGATVSILNIFQGVKADLDGQFLIPKLTEGKYTVEISNIGYETLRLDSVRVTSGATSELEVRLKPKSIPLKNVTVTPSQFSIMGTQPVTRQSLTRKEMSTVPQLGDDFFRAVNRLPGVSGNDMSTRITVRGGEFEELLVTMDGLEIYEPFHLKDIDGGAISIIDIAAVEGIDIITGGFPANYGDRLSGVFNIKSRPVPADNHRIAFGLSFMNARAYAEGTFADNRGNWLLSARRGYIDLVLQMAGADDEIKPTYYDVFAKTQYQLGRNFILSANVLHAGDDLSYKGKDEEDGDTLITSYGNSYGWLTLLSTPHPRLSIRTMASAGQVSHDRWGQMFMFWNQRIGCLATDIKDFKFAGIKNDLEWELSERYLIKFGVDVRRLWADYDYLSQDFHYDYNVTPDSTYISLNRIDSTLADFNKKGYKTAAYISNRVRLAEPITVELGVRYDHASYTDDENVSPRVNMVYDLSTKTTLRAGWGKFYQIEGIDGIAVGDGETDYSPAERADHWVVGLDHDLRPGFNIRLEAYHKRYKSLAPEMRNTFDEIKPFPELEEDRMIVFRENSISKGLELYIKSDNGGKFSWWTSYAYAKVEDSVKYIYYPDEDVYAYGSRIIPSMNDQRHTFYFDLSFRPNYYWQFNTAFQLHSGWPYTGAYMATYNDGNGDIYYIQAAEPLSSRHKTFSRLDLRANRYIKIGNGRLVVFVELINALGRKNVRGYEYDLLQNRFGYYLDKDPEYWFGRLPSFGINYELNF